jgi:hypothetical protein
LASVIAGAPRLAAAPVANRRSVSEVEVSLSTVTALKVLPTARDSRSCKTGAAIGASVATKDSMVAMSGAIMPAPLAMPLIVTVAAPSLTVRVAPFGKVSVVMMARAASTQGPAAARDAASGRTASNSCSWTGSPITPGGSRNTSSGRQ